MPAPTQYAFSHKELVTLMIKSAGIHEGRWWLVTNFGFAPGNFGPTENAMSPGVAIIINSLAIHRETPETPAPSALVVDAAEVNPAPSAKKSRK